MRIYKKKEIDLQGVKHEFYEQDVQDSYFICNKDTSNLLKKLMNEKYQKYTPIKEGMKIFIPKRLKRHIYIRKVNKYIKDNNLDIKIVNKLEEANSIVYDSNYFYAYVYNMDYFFYDNKNNDYVKYFYNEITNDKNLTKIDDIVEMRLSFSNSIFDNECKNRLELVEHLVNRIDNIINLEDMKDLASNTHVKYSSDIELDMEMIENMLSSEATTETLCLALQNRNITPYLKEITELFYKSLSYNVKVILMKKLFKYFGIDKYYYVTSQSNYMGYLSTMKNLNLKPDKEYVLNLIRFYEYFPEEEEKEENLQLTN